MNELLVDVRKIDGTGSIRAIVTISIPTPFGMLTIHQARLIQKTESPDGSWVAYPQISFTKDGKTHYRDILEVPWPMKKEIHERVIKQISQD